MTQTFEIPFRLPGLNDYINAERANRFAAAKLKKQTQEAIKKCTVGLTPVTKPVKISFIWQGKTARRDIDNISAAKKFILDALVASGLLPDDSRKWVKGFDGESFPIGKEDKITVTLEELDNG